jgi:hypothetical protein
MYDVHATSKNSSEIARAPVNTRLSGNLLAPFRHQVVHCEELDYLTLASLFFGNSDQPVQKNPDPGTGSGPTPSWNLRQSFVLAMCSQSFFATQM